MKQWNKLLALCCALALAVTALPVLAEAAPAEASAEAHGFTLQETGEFSLVNADTLLYTHDKTGAQVLFVLNDDPNRTFELSFVTPALSDKGTTHVFEHATTDGSEKYPPKSLFFNLLYQTYNTFMNAYTYNIMTTYPVASLSEAQLLKYADYYVDSCFNPVLYNDESIFREEAWRYSMEDADAPLTIAGTVYSEMLGAYTLASAADSNAFTVIAPGSPESFVSGGKPEAIPELTWQDLMDYHTEYYHPSNSLAIVYGDIEDTDAFLALLDGYYSAFEKKDFPYGFAGEAITESVEKVFDYPVEEGTPTENASVIYYAILCPGAEGEEIDVLDLLTSLIGDVTSAMTENLRKALPAASVSAYIDTLTPVPAVVFVANGVEEDDAETLKTTIMDSLKQTAEEGFSDDVLDAIEASLSMEIKLIAESSSIGTDLMPNLSYYWAMTGDVHGYEKNIENLNNFHKFADEGKYAEIINKYLLKEDAVTATVVTRPVPGLQEQNDAALAESLAEIKAGMSEEEIAAIVADTAALAEGASEDASQYVAQLQAVTVDSLPEELRVYDVQDETGADGVRRLNVEANVDGIGQAYMLLNAASLSQEDIHWFKLYTELMGELDTTAHTRMELTSLVTRYLYNPTIRVSVVESDSEAGYTPYLGARFTATDEDLPAAYDLVYELLFDTQFTDAQAVRDYISQSRVAMRQEIDGNSYSMQLARAQALSDPTSAYFNYASNLDYYAFLAEADALLESDPDAALQKLKDVQARLKNKTAAVTIYAGTAEGIAANEQAADAFLNKLGDAPVEPAAYDLPLTDAAEAMVINSSVNFNMIYASMEQLGLEKYTGDLDVITALVSDAILYPFLRDQYGAYSVLHGATEDGMYIVSYRDPNILETYEVYTMLPDLMPQLQAMLDQEILDGYIMSAYSYYAMPTGELTGAMTAALDTLEGEDPTRALDWMRELKAVTVDDIAGYADIYAALLENGAISTSGSQSAINAVMEQDGEGGEPIFQTVIVP